MIYREIGRTRARLKILEQYVDFLNALQEQNIDEAHWKEELQALELQQKELHSNASEDNRNVDLSTTDFYP